MGKDGKRGGGKLDQGPLEGATRNIRTASKLAHIRHAHPVCSFFRSKTNTIKECNINKCIDSVL